MTKRSVRLMVLFIGCMLFFIGGCQTFPRQKPIEKNGKTYGVTKGAFRHRWWNYYERGLSYSDGECYRESLIDLKEAVRQREADQRMARTYGMHFIDYFPHREIGVVYYLMGEYEQAKSELELSVSQYPSSKAAFYLDRVRKHLFMKEAGESLPPKLMLAIQSDEIWTKEDPVIISGVAEDNRFVSAISVGKLPVFLTASQRRIPFEKKLTLDQGSHTIAVTAKNLMGMTSTRELVVHVDREGPMVTFEQIELAGMDVNIAGTVYDEAGVETLTIDGETFPTGRKTEIPFSKKVTIGKSDFLNLEATDRLGNPTVSQFPIAGKNFRQASLWVAGLDSDFENRLYAMLLASSDNQPPKIHLKDLTQEQTVYLDKIYISGEVTDESPIETLTINQDSILRKKGLGVVFNQLIDLEEGENSIKIHASDEAGNAAEQVITVTRAVPSALQMDERLTLSVMPFELKNIISDAVQAYQDNLIDALLDQNRFQIVERNKLDMILQEQKLSATDLVDRQTAIRMGQLVAAQSIITGSIIETHTGIEIVGRMMDTETSEILVTEDVYDEVKDLQAMRKLAQGMAIRLHTKFPLVDGFVMMKKGSDIFTDLGADKIALKRRLIFYREEKITHPITGKVLGANTIITGKGRVTQVLPDMSKIKLISGKADDINPMDKVIPE